MKTLKSESKKTTAPTPARVTTVTTPAAKAPATPAPARGTIVTIPAAKAPAAAPATKPHREITGQCIASRAYSLWEQQGRPHGRDLELWLQAEKQIKQTSQSCAV